MKSSLHVFLENKHYDLEDHRPVREERKVAIHSYVRSVSILKRLREEIWASFF